MSESKNHSGREKNKMIGKIFGKIFSYLGLLIAIGGIFHDDVTLFLIGVIILGVAVIVHEVDEK